MTDLVIADHQATFALHPLEGSSRFSLLGLLAGLNGLVRLNNHADPYNAGIRPEHTELEAETLHVAKRKDVLDALDANGFPVVSLEPEHQGNK